MKQIVFVSGKGGTGKTSLVASFALFWRPVVAADCDVDAANLRFLLKGTDGPAQPFEAGQRAVLDAERCDSCQACLPLCRFGALAVDESGRVQIDALLCEGCRACGSACPTAAISFRNNLAGHWWVRSTGSGVLVHAELGVAQDNSGKLVAKVRAVAREQAQALGYQWVLIDGPPGIGCPVHAAITGADAVIAVTEPTVAAEHDLERMLDLASRFRCPAAVIINKWSLSPAGSERLTRLCTRLGVPVLARIPFDTAVTRLLSRSLLLVALQNDTARAVRAAERSAAAWLGLTAETAPAQAG
jgi:MinD superfamily P-loop ATPase